MAPKNRNKSKTPNPLKASINSKKETESNLNQPQTTSESSKQEVDTSGLKRSGLKLVDLVGEIIMPGDELIIGNEFRTNLGDNVVILGPGLMLKSKRFNLDNSNSNEDDGDESVVIASRGGVLVFKSPNTYFIQNSTRAYVPYKKEDVVGVVTKRGGDQYVVDVGTRDRVILSKFAFEGATKKNKPELKVGDVIFGRFLPLPSDYPFELTCVVESSGRSMGLGPLEGGFLFTLPLAQNNSLKELLDKLGVILPFEIVLGVNGYAWVKSSSDIFNLLLAQTIQSGAGVGAEHRGALLKFFRKRLEELNGLIVQQVQQED